MYLGLKIENSSHSQTNYFSTPGFLSEGGYRLAHHCATGLDHALRSSYVPPTEAAGRQVPVLRQTRMPAVLCTLAPPSAVVLATAEIAAALAMAITRWLANPAADPDQAPPVED